MISKKKKIFILVGMVALLVVTGVLNIYLNANADKAVGGKGDTGGQDSIFDTVRYDRNATRSETLLVLESIINNDLATEEARAQALADKLAITKFMDCEFVLEGLIKALGYTDVIVTASTQYVNVIIKIEAEDLTEPEVATITHLILSETDKTASDVRLLPIN